LAPLRYEEVALDPSVLHSQVEKAFNDGDVDALVDLYEPDARMMRDDGSVAVGPEEIRDIWSGFVAMGGRISLTTHYAVGSGDVALLSNSWTYEGDGMTFSSTTAEVARRQDDGSWRYVIDNPYSAGEAAP
jgi:ketosteroid isomerase-like protein